MANKKFLYWTTQFLGWLFYYFIIGINLFTNNNLNEKTVGMLISMYAASVGLTHFLRLFFIKKEYINLKINRLFPRAIISSIVVGTILVLYQNVIDRWVFRYDTSPIDAGTFFQELLIDSIAGSILIFLWVVFYFAYQYFDKSRREEIKNLQWEALQNQIELNNLKSQLNPHFMFNSLNSIRALIDINQKDAKESITKLSTLLRTSLLMGKKNVVSIEEEINLVKNYLDLEKIRFEERLRVKWNITEESKEVEIPPLMIQTLVENSIKHGISKKMEGGEIQISARIESDTCLIEIRNPGELASALDENASIGLKNTRDRLRLMFGNKGSFELNQEAGDVVARIRIKQV